MNVVSASLQIVPVPALGVAVALIEQIWDVVRAVQSNKAQCLRLGERAKEVLIGVNDALARQAGGASEKSTLPEVTQRNIQDLESTLGEINTFVSSLVKRSFIRQLLDKGTISDKLTEYNQRLETCCTLFTIKAVIDIQGWLAEDRRDQEADTAELHDVLRRGLESGNAAVHALQIKQDQILDAMLAIHSHMDRFAQGTLERRFAEHGLATLQRRSGSSPGTQPDWIISGFDLNWEEKPFDSGGFGDVYRGRWSGTEVAVKLLRSDTSKQDLRTEVEIWQKLRHPHIHRFFGCSLDWDPPFIVSELCAWEVARGMQYLHSKNIIHGDLKASNVLMSDRRSALITDFGLSRIFVGLGAQSTHSSRADHWKAPETLSKGEYSKSSDVYSWGMTVLELFTGNPPFSDVFDIVAHVVGRRQYPARPPPGETPTLSDGLWNLMQESWGWEATHRPTFMSIADRMARLVPPPGAPSGAVEPLLPCVLPMSQTFIESPVLTLNLGKATTISAWARRGSIVPRTVPPTQPRFMFSLEAEADNGKSIVAVGLEGGKHEPAVLAWLWPRNRDTGYTVLTSKSAMPARAQPRAEWVRTMWVHIAIVWDEHIARLYMNGELHDSAQIVTFEHRPKVRLVIGRGLYAGKAAYQWDGLVENLKVSQSAWSSVSRSLRKTKPSLQGSGFSVQPYEDPY
ncbi:kinase-like protein [Auricularia subglabra TFB-10046 SS5]|nr:kinase-like protein [Auricularia subglabra TFB-10046 SS5]